jgi:hypothetical protein
MNPQQRALTRHFVRHFVNTSSEGADGVRRVMLGAMSAVIAVGLFLPRLLGRKYVGIRGIPDLYEATVVGDTLMTMAFAMLIVAFAAALAGDSMFPDETDFRVLTPLPVTRGFVFAAKLRAVALYLGLVMVIVSAAIQVPFTAVSGGPYASRPWIVRAFVSTTTSMGASLFAATAIMAAQGVIVLCAPGRYLRPLTVGTRTAFLCGVVLLLPLAGRLPSQAAEYLIGSGPLSVVPTAWFLGMQRVLLGSSKPYDLRMTLVAIAVLMLTSVVIAACYVALYQRFDVLMMRIGPSGSRTSDGARGGSATAPMVPLALAASAPAPLGPLLGSLPAGRDQTAVVRRFAVKTLWRSPLQQVVFLGTTACGLGWVLNGFLAGGLLDWLRDGGVAPPRLVSSASAMPFVLLLAGTTGLRGALMLPQEPRANWIFRLREDDAYRPGQLDAVEGLFLRLVVAPVLVFSFAVQWAIIGFDALAALPIAYLMGVLLVELVTRTWRRIPFTCGYIPGKRNVAQTVLIALTAYVFFTMIGRGLVSLASFHPSRMMIAVGVLMIAVAVLRWSRLKSWGQTPLMFDDDPPEFAQPIQLL